jgi:hypothetical protein
MTKKELKFQLVDLIQLINSDCKDISITDDFEDVFETLRLYFIYLSFDNLCLKEEIYKLTKGE